MAKQFDMAAAAASKIEQAKAKPEPAKDTPAQSQDTKTTTGRRRTDSKVNLSFAVTAETRRALKDHALRNDTSVQALLDDALEMYFTQRDIRPIK